MTFRLLLLTATYQFVFGGISILYFSEILTRLSVIAFFILLILMGYLSNKRKSINYASFHFKSSLQYTYFKFIIILCVSFYTFKFQYFGFPMLEPNPNIARVEFARELDFITTLFKNSGFIALVYFCISKRLKWQIISIIVLTLIGFFSGYRSAAAFPLILTLFVNFVTSPNSIWEFIKKYFLPSLIFLIFIVAIITYLTFLRFATNDQDFFSAFIMLSERILYVNYLNFERVSRVFESGPILLASIYWDFESLFTSKMGFSGRVTELIGFANYENFQLTPTFLGEAYANFHQFLFLYAFLVFLVARFVIYIVRKSKNEMVLVTSICWAIFLPLSTGMGLGSYLFNYTPKFIITGCFILLTWQYFKFLPNKNLSYEN